MKLYALADGPPSLAVRMVMKALDLDYEYIAVDYNGGEHLRDEYAKVGKNSTLVNLLEKKMSSKQNISYFS